MINVNKNKTRSHSTECLWFDDLIVPINVKIVLRNIKVKALTLDNEFDCFTNKRTSCLSNGKCV